MGKAKDVSGLKFGRLTAIERTGDKTIHGYLWRCSCDCGGDAVVVLSRLITGHTRSCGCLVKEQAKMAKRVTHGHTRMSNRASASEYHIWSTMKQRCLNPASASYSRYGGRGITVCPEWAGDNGYANFFADMGKRPSDKHSLDRIDTNGNYEPSNCRWATSEEQNNNRSGVRSIEWNGQTMTSAAWSRRVGISAMTIRSRLDKGWSVERALTEPLNKTRRRIG